MQVAVIGAGRGLMQTLKAIRPIATHVTVITPGSAVKGADALIRRVTSFASAADAYQVIHHCGGDAQMQRLWSQQFTPLGTPYDGVPFGVMQLIAHAQQLGSMQDALDVMRQQIRCEVEVYLVSESVHHVLVHTINGDVVQGMPDTPTTVIQSVSLSPQVQTSAAVIRALRVAQLVVIAPGSLYTNVLPALLPHGMADTMRNMTAQVVCVTPLSTVHGQTDAYRAVDYVARVSRVLGRGSINTALVNTSPYTPQQRAFLTQHGVAPLVHTADDQSILQALGIQMIGRDMLLVDDQTDLSVARLTTHHETELRRGCVLASKQ
jgi:uncharacterized cofD-like protein